MNTKELLERQKANLEDLRRLLRIRLDLVADCEALIIAAENHIRLLELPEETSEAEHERLMRLEEAKV